MYTNCGHCSEFFSLMSLQDFLLKRVGPDNVRIKLHPSTVGLHEFDTEQNNNEGALSRNDIKLQGQRLMDSKIKPKKKKQPARKK